MRALFCLLAAFASAAGSSPARAGETAASTQTRGAPSAGACAASEASPERSEPLSVPERMRSLASSDRTRLAVRSFAGATLCIDIGWMEQFGPLALSDDGRFLQFGWSGYESFGHLVVDRAGKGAWFDTGTTPAFSPDRRHIAAVDIDQSAFGALGGFAVWQITGGGTRQVAKFPMDGVPGSHWQLIGWRGDRCVELAVFDSEQFYTETGPLPPELADRWHATPARNWEPQPGACDNP